MIYFTFHAPLHGRLAHMEGRYVFERASLEGFESSCGRNTGEAESTSTDGHGMQKNFEIRILFFFP